jgi:hypothetical protein
VKVLSNTLHRLQPVSLWFHGIIAPEQSLVAILKQNKSVMSIVHCYSACGIVTLIFSCSCREQDQDLAVAEKLMEGLNKKQQRFSTYKLNNKKPLHHVS